MNMEWQVDLKCRLHYYSGMARLTDQETIAVAKIICYSQFPKGESCHTMQGTWGSTRAAQETKGTRGKYELEHLLQFPLER